MFDLIRFDHNSQRFVMRDLRAPANAFEWKRFVVEEAERRGDKPSQLDAGTTSRERSVASTKAVERLRETKPKYGTVGIGKKTAEMIELKPKNFSIYSKARTKKEVEA
jgi:hypothetical protein